MRNSVLMGEGFRSSFRLQGCVLFDSLHMGSVSHGSFAEFPLFHVEMDQTSDPEVDSRRLRSTRKCILTGR